MPNYLNNPYYGRQVDLATPMNNLARALLGTAQDDSDIARAQANRALSERYTIEGKKLAQEAEIKRLEAERAYRGQRNREALAASPTVQQSLATALGIQPMSNGDLPPIIQEYAAEYFNRDGKINDFANANRTMQGVSRLLTPDVGEDAARIGGALLGMEPDKNTAYTFAAGNSIRADDNQVIRDRDTARDATARYGIDKRDGTQRRGQDIASSDRRRGQDIGSSDRRRGQDMASSDRQRGQDMRGERGGAGNKPAIFGGAQEKAATKILDDLLNGDDMDDQLREQIMGRASELYQDTKNLRTAVQDAFDEVTSGEDASYEEVPWYKSGKTGYKVKPGAEKPKGGAKPEAAPAAKGAAPANIDMEKANSIRDAVKAGKLSRAEGLRQLQALGFQ